MPRFSPFKNFLTQGMQNTNKNINKLNMPSFGQSGQLFGDPGDYMGGYTGSEGETGSLQGPALGGGTGGGGIGGGTGGGTEPPEWTPEQTELWMSVQGPGGWLDEGWDEYIQSMGYTSNNVLDDISDMIQNEGSSYEDIINMLQGGYGFNQSGGWGASGIDIDTPEYLQEDPLADYTYSPSPAGAPEESITDSLTSPGRRLAKKLYYPGTQGGFASVGSGIGGQTNILDDLLKQLQG